MTARRAAPRGRHRLKPVDIDFRFMPAKRADWRMGWPFAVFYVGPQAVPRRRLEDKP